MTDKDKSILVIKFRKRHIALAIVLIAIIGFSFSVYLRFFTVLPQSTASIFSQLPVDLAGKSVLIYSPHCDDESLGAFGVIKKTLASGGKVHLVMVTDCNKHGIGSTRKAETIAAMKIAGLDSGNIEFLNFSEESEKKDASESERFKKIVRSEIDNYRPDYIFSPHSNDTHMDHRFVGKSISEISQEYSLNDKTVYYLIHYNFLRYPSPPGLRPDAYLLPPSRLISFTERWYKFDLSSEEEDQKEDAILTYKSQLKKSNPVLMRILLDFVRQNELFMMKHNAE